MWCAAASRCVSLRHSCPTTWRSTSMRSIAPVPARIHIVRSASGRRSFIRLRRSCSCRLLRSSLGRSHPAVWMLVNLGLYTVTMRLLWVAVRDVGAAAAVSGPANTRSRLLTTPAMLFVVIFLLYAPLLEGLVVGQTDVLVLAGLAAVHDPRSTDAGIDRRARSRGCDLWIEISPILLLVVAIAGRDWRTVARVAGILFALSVVAIGLYGWTPWAGFVAVLPSLAAGEAGLDGSSSTGATIGRFRSCAWSDTGVCRRSRGAEQPGPDRLGAVGSSHAPARVPA